MRKKLKLAYITFEDTLKSLLEKAKTGPVSINTCLTILSGRGKVLLLVFLLLGFSQIPGVGIFLGLIISYLGVRIAIAKSFIWMPKKLLHKKIPSYFLIKVIKQLLHFLKLMKRWSWSRYAWLAQDPKMRFTTGLMIALVGLSIAISPPLPLIGLFTFVSIFLLAIGLLNNDGIYIILGYVTTIFYFVVTIFLLKYFFISILVINYATRLALKFLSSICLNYNIFSEDKIKIFV